MREMVVTRGLGKKYRLSGSPRPNVLREKLAGALRSLIRPRPTDADQEFWALRDVSISIGEAEVVGLIGKNGAGKSTLLKILSQITEPTEGEAHLFGRVASLLEVGIGFHPELSGRENIFLNGAILGMKRSEIRRKFDEIVQFAEVDRFLDTPVKRYSSGMYVRLAFAVAAHLDPDILLVDEVLAVGDAAFQQKCLGKMRSIRQEGKTVIVVSHSMPTVMALSQKVIWLDRGSVRTAGATTDVVGRYLSEGIQNDITWSPRVREPFPFNYDSVFVIRGDTGESSESIPGDAPIDVVIDFTIAEPLPPGRIELRVANDLGELLFTTTSADAIEQQAHPWLLGRQRLHCRIPPHLLAPGRYYVSITEPRGGYAILRDNILSFTVSEQRNLAALDGRSGKIAPMLEWTVFPRGSNS